MNALESFRASVDQIKLEKMRMNSAQDNACEPLKRLPVKMKTGHDLLLYRTVNHLSQKALGRQIGVSPRLIGKYEMLGVELNESLRSMIEGHYSRNIRFHLVNHFMHSTDSTKWVEWLHEHTLRVTIRERECSECGSERVLIEPVKPEIKVFQSICEDCGNIHVVNSVSEYRDWYWRQNFDLYNEALYSQRSTSYDQFCKLRKIHSFSNALFWFVRNVMSMTQHDMSQILDLSIHKVANIELGTRAIDPMHTERLIQFLLEQEIDENRLRAMIELCPRSAYDYYTEAYPGVQIKRVIQSDIRTGRIFELVSQNTQENC